MAQALHLALPAISSDGPTFAVNTSPVAILSILDHYLRRPEPKVQYVLGALLGQRSEEGRVLQITTSLPIPFAYDEAEGLDLDVDHFRTLYDLHQRVNPKEVLVGWYATSTDGLPSFASVVQDFFSREASPLPAVHLSVDPGVESGSLDVKAFTTVGLNTSEEASDFLFLPVPCSIIPNSADKASLDILTQEKEQGEEEEGPVEKLPILSDLALLEKSIVHLQDTLVKVSEYVGKVLTGQTPANVLVGRAILDAVATVPKLDVSTFQTAFNSHLQDLLMVTYLADITRAQLAVSRNLQTLV
ncbi:eukaryotic translation initiation factor 3 subunit F [Piptocephalis cylindrospora]|uniref:Eukaryotic translation initiation factor 3 subunit F n=1 Tax=Piptocephalis cylindrospora TaxID=1907219 RepID=A0A4P9XZ66_9FUNG|nr:eukaryotic translation initiation factor 3 subunit F [Piptocephalis cylindrospora]|eukprot:RKP11778.1 eukaryotic translation initiation factor 3 subunit F [Piptocephalis cylindrospora]